MGGKVVCVTGAAGFVASWLVKHLLDTGYTVKGTVRNRNDPKKVSHLMALEGAKERLQLYEADLLDEGSFDSAVDGCEGVFHTSSPVILSASDPQKELIDPAVKGTLNVLRSCKKVPSIKRVVITSSMASVMTNKNPLNSGVVIDESGHSDPDFCEEIKNWYCLSKTLAEKSAWEFALENSMDLVVLHPGLVIGPLLQPTLNVTSQVVLNMITTAGKQRPGDILVSVDVRDVARAHILAFENSSASGRYCLVESVIHWSEFLAKSNQIFPSLNIPLDHNDEIEGSRFQVSKKKAKSLGLEYTPFEVSLKDTLESLKHKTFLTL